MNFELDKQTIRDLEIFSEEKSSKSVYGYFNLTKTIGGRDYLYELMRYPLTDIREIKQRQELIRFFCNTNIEVKINSGQFDFIEHYLRLNVPTLRNNAIDAVFQYLSYHLNPKNDYYIIQSGIQNLLYLFHHLSEIIDLVKNYPIPQELQKRIELIKRFFELPDNKDLFFKQEKISCFSLNRFDNRFRKRYKNILRTLLSEIYYLDALIAVGKAAKHYHLCFPDYFNRYGTKLSITGLYHPLLTDAVPYDVTMDASKNLCFLTGPNMAGKSTFLKSLGIAIYLAHLGFPVPAASMTTSLYHGIITTINLSDNMGKGYSHFYSEVRRVKETALMLREKQRLFVVFDELFRGTNVKDAYDASLLIIRSFAAIGESTFFISTHLKEIAEDIKNLDSIHFRYFESELQEDQPVYNFNLREGVSNERLGMHILRQEKIVEILNSIHPRH